MKLRWLLALIATLGGIANAGGADVFNSHCVICHQPNAAGVPGMYPPLADSIGNYVRAPEGRAYLVHVVAFGLTGPISVHGQTYLGLMQSWPGLSDDEIAQVLNYLLTNFNSELIPKDFVPLTPNEVTKYRTSNVSIGELLKQRAALIKSVSAAAAGS